jgi:hypothetical protein
MKNKIKTKKLMKKIKKIRQGVKVKCKVQGKPV